MLRISVYQAILELKESTEWERLFTTIHVI